MLSMPCSNTIILNPLLKGFLLEGPAGDPVPAMWIRCLQGNSNEAETDKLR